MSTEFDIRNNLIHASLNGDIEYVDRIFNSELIKLCDDSTACQMFMISATNGHLEIVKAIFESKELKNKVNKGPFLKNALAKVFPNGYLEVIAFILEKLEVFKDKLDNLKMNIDNVVSIGIDETIKKGHLNVVQYFLEEKPYDIIWDKYITGTMLNTACSYDHLNIVKYLMESNKLSSKVNIHINQDVAFKATHFNQNLEIIKYMIFDLNLEKTPCIEKHLKDYKLEINDTINTWFEAKELNSDLSAELQSKDLSTKRAKI